jgi:hypothetical protein
LFPLAVPLAARFTLRNVETSRALVATATLSVGLAGILALLSLYPPAAEFLVIYLQSHVIPGVTSQAEVLDASVLDQPAFLGALLRNLAVPGLLAFAVLSARRFVGYMGYRGTIAGARFAPAAFCLVLALAASLPLLVSGKLRTHYIVPSLALYALSLAAFSAHALPAPGGPSRWRRPLRAALGIGLIGLAAVAIDRRGSTARDHEMIPDVRAIGGVVPAGSVIRISAEIASEWSLRAYIQRYHRISLAVGEVDSPYLVGPAHASYRPPDGFERVALSTTRFALFERVLPAPGSI